MIRANKLQQDKVIQKGHSLHHESHAYLYISKVGPPRLVLLLDTPIFLQVVSRFLCMVIRFLYAKRTPRRFFTPNLEE